MQDRGTNNPLAMLAGLLASNGSETEQRDLAPALEVVTEALRTQAGEEGAARRFARMLLSQVEDSTLRARSMAHGLETDALMRMLAVARAKFEDMRKGEDAAEFRRLQQVMSNSPGDPDDKTSIIHLLRDFCPKVLRIVVLIVVLDDELDRRAGREQGRDPAGSNENSARSIVARLRPRRPVAATG